MFLVPKPHKFTELEGKLNVTSLKVVSDKEFSFFANIDNGGATVVDIKKCDCGIAEKYKINIDEKGIHIRYADDEAAYRARTTLGQILDQAEDGCVTYLEIEDQPSIKNRAYMLDISRGKIPNLSYLKELVDILAALKYNQLQLYMDTFIYEYKGFEEYWKDTQPLSVAEIRELDAYCKERFILLVPVQNSFAHMAAWTAKPELSHLAITRDGKPSQTLNPLHPGSLELMDKIYESVCEGYSSELFNIGMDEPFELGMNETKEECDKKGVGRVYTEYLEKICDLVCKKYKKQPMFFDDIVFKHPEELANVPKNAIVMQWGYESEQQFDRNCRLIRDHGLRFYVCPGTSMWGSITGRTNNANMNIWVAAECGAYYGAEGFLLTEWGDDGHPQFASTTYYPIVVGAYASWNCINHNSEFAVTGRREMVANSKKYVDRYLYKTTGEKSLADVVYRMGNYYLLEELLQFNGTDFTNCYMRRYQLEPFLVTGIKRVREYMQGLRRELDECRADETVLSEVKLNCDMVLLLADLMLGEKNEAECERVFAEYRRVWLLKNHEAGVELFLDIMKSWL